MKIYFKPRFVLSWLQDFYNVEFFGIMVFFVMFLSPNIGILKNILQAAIFLKFGVSLNALKALNLTC